MVAWALPLAQVAQPRGLALAHAARDDRPTCVTASRRRLAAVGHSHPVHTSTHKQIHVYTVDAAGTALIYAPHAAEKHAHSASP